MFKVIEDPQFVAEVPVDVPDGEGWTTRMLRTRFRALPVSELRAVESGELSADDMIERAVVGFENLTDEAGAPLDGTGAWRDRMLEWPFVRMPLLRAYRRALVEERLGNSAPSEGGGPAVN